MMMYTSKYSQFKQLLLLYYKEVSKTITTSLVLKNKFAKYGLVLGCLACYGIYIWVNYQVKFLVSNKQLDPAVIALTYFSTISTIIVSTFLIFFITEINVTISRSTYYLLKCMPFSKELVSFSLYFFNLLINWLLFSLLVPLLIIVVSLYETNFMNYLGHILFAQLLFFLCYNLFVLFKSLMIRLFGRAEKRIDLIILSMFFFWYFFAMRFSIELFLSQVAFAYLKHVAINNAVLLLMNGLLLAILYCYVSPNHYLIEKSEYSQLKIIPRLKMNVFMKMFLQLSRNKSFILSYKIILIVAFTAFWDTKSPEMFMMTYIYYYSIVNIVLLKYYSQTERERKLYPLFRISIVEEVMALCLLCLLINIPQFIYYTVINNGSDIENFFISVLIFLLSLLFGIIFPIKKNSVNALVASIMMSVVGVAIIVISSTYQNSWILLGSILLSILSVYYLLKLERSK